MNIVYSTSDLYSPLAGISLTSFFINNKEANDINVMIIDNGISNSNKEKLTATVNKYGKNLTFLKLPKKLTGSNINAQKWNISTFGRLFTASLLPNIDKIIYIDCDTIIDKSLKSLWNLDMGKSTVAGVMDCIGDEYKVIVGLNPEDKYFNTGILVLNLKRIRELKLEKDFEDHIKKYGNFLTYVDQEVLNTCVPENEKMEIEPKYNSYSIIHYLSYEQLKVCRGICHNIWNPQIYEEAKTQPVVIHYTSCFLEGTRPWIQGDKHPLKYKFDEYKQKSLWADMPAWESKKSAKQRAIAFIVKVTPKCVLLPVVGFVHGTVVPWRNKRKQERGLRLN